MAIWKKIDRSENSEGTTITYAVKGQGKRVLVQSRRRHIPHANRGGTWDQTFYYVLKDGEEVKQTWRLMDAKEYAEELIGGTA